MNLHEKRASERLRQIELEIHRIGNEMGVCEKQSAQLKKLYADLATKLVTLKGEQNALKYVLDSTPAADGASGAQ